jgi:hypothetical protein
MAKRSGGPNKSVAIRDYKAAHSDAGPKAIAEALGKDGVKVTPAFVSTVLSNDRRKAGKARRRRRGGVGRRGAPRGGLRGNRALANLIQAKKLAEQMGGIEPARRALNALAKLLG